VTGGGSGGVGGAEGRTGGGVWEDFWGGEGKSGERCMWAFHNTLLLVAGI
jgi:hypothetical protein